MSLALAEKFARKTTDDAVQAARERYLQRKQLQQQQAQKKKKWMKIMEGNKSK